MENSWILKDSYVIKMLQHVIKTFKKHSEKLVSIKSIAFTPSRIKKKYIFFFWLEILNVENFFFFFLGGGKVKIAQKSSETSIKTKLNLSSLTTAI